jgi:sigma-B regulation protein RsbU (phosphoserine phosphatase)
MRIKAVVNGESALAQVGRVQRGQAAVAFHKDQSAPRPRARRMDANSNWGVNEQAHLELEGVAEIQRLLLPCSLPSIQGYDLAVDYCPRERSGGDYYDLIELHAGKWGLLIADVCGRGAPAAMGTALLHAMVCAAPDRESPARLMSWLNGQLAGGYSSNHGRFVTAFYVVLDPVTGTITFANAGHNPPLLWSGGGWRQLDRARSLPLGILADETFGEGQDTLVPGGAIALYTDGITEARNTRGAMFGVTRLRRISRRPEDPAVSTARAIKGAVRRFCGSRRVEDDQTILVIAADPRTEPNAVSHGRE